MRTISDIFNEIGNAYIAVRGVQVLYGLDENKTFAEQFSPVSIESIIFYRVAYIVWTLESLFALFRQEIESLLSTKKPARLPWYKNMLLAFQKDYILPPDTDVYNVIDESAMVVKYAAAVEPSDSSKILIKIAGGDSLRDKLDDETAEQVRAYLRRIKPAGIRIDLVNEHPDAFICEIDIYYDAMLLADRVEESARKAIESYIENLPFNGEYSNVALTDVLQGIEGIIIPELKAAYSRPSHADYKPTLINAKRIPEAGYFRAYESGDITLNMIAYELLQD
ncbi:MAG: hypothetical protein E6767_20380 [Dysgonomonas sp.]|nr:hypothetical protein [Dysgonomonas sp.]